MLGLSYKMDPDFWDYLGREIPFYGTVTQYCVGLTMVSNFDIHDTITIRETPITILWAPDKKE